MIWMLQCMLYFTGRSRTQSICMWMCVWVSLLVCDCVCVTMHINRKSAFTWNEKHSNVPCITFQNNLSCIRIIAIYIHSHICRHSHWKYVRMLLQCITLWEKSILPAMIKRARECCNATNFSSFTQNIRVWWSRHAYGRVGTHTEPNRTPNKRAPYTKYIALA